MKRRRAEESADGLALMTSSVTSSQSADSMSPAVARYQQSTKISAEDEFSRSDKSAAKQLTIYEIWMSTAELNSNGENDKKPAKEKDTTDGAHFNLWCPLQLTVPTSAYCVHFSLWKIAYDIRRGKNAHDISRGKTTYDLSRGKTYELSRGKQLKT
ncbi:protein FLX-like 2-like [Dorcoceras hygrometricum]|uniref:Protein FLX-like 2-like n=1 Tax=Dorcoceras hygrometricum TaxID=472368 RepID=A0A2Z7CBA9_9LAMI|nr:protein FLX-like 2-like [Dorcoceras hygrometricum]